MKQFIFLISIFLYCASLSGKDVNIKDFGAVGNRIVDDTKSIQKAFNYAIENNLNIYIPSGSYKITKTLNISLKPYQSIVINGVKENNNLNSIIFSEKFISLIEASSSFNIPTGSLLIKNISLRGNNVSYSTYKKHPYLNGEKYVNGIAVYNLKEVILLENKISNVYGEGINLNNYIYTKDEPYYFTSVIIENNTIENVWGMNHINRNGRIDDYGDGIYLANVHNGIIINNNIINNVSLTNYMGRSGIVIEYNCFNCLVKKNTISGYDRDIHIEADQGGHTIENNELQGSDIGIYIYSPKNSFKNKPLTIKNNNISNKYAPYSKVYIPNMDNGNGRALIIFKDFDNSRAGSTISNNTFTLLQNKVKSKNSLFIVSNIAGLYLYNNFFKSNLFRNYKDGVIINPISNNLNNKYEVISSYK